MNFIRISIDPDRLYSYFELGLYLTLLATIVSFFAAKDKTRIANQIQPLSFRFYIVWLQFLLKYVIIILGILFLLFSIQIGFEVIKEYF